MLEYNNISSVLESHFNVSLPTKFIIHGFGSSCSKVWPREMRLSFLHVVSHLTHHSARQNGDFGQNFHLFSANFLSMVPHPPFFRPYVYRLRLFPPISAYFPPIFCLFLPIFRLFSAYFPPVVPHPYYKLKHVTHFPPTCLRILLIFRLFSAHFPPIFRLKFRPFSAGPVLPGNAPKRLPLLYLYLIFSF